MKPTTAPKVVILGLMSTMPVSGVVWQTIHYLLGIDLLGFEAYYVESHARTPSMLMSSRDDDSSAISAGFIAAVMHRFGFDRRWAFHALHADGRCYGMSNSELSALYRDAACIVNLHGGTKPLPEHCETGRLVYVETDPVLLQIELASGNIATDEFLEPHCAFFTFAENWGNSNCLLPPTKRFEFRPTRQPVVMDLWRSTSNTEGGRFTTIGNWDQAREVTIDGEAYSWSKKKEFLKFVGLPRRSRREFELALSNCPSDDARNLEDAGWRVRDAAEVSGSLDAYRRYIHDSCGEFTTAKDQNVRLRTGWFSDRSATYLASGRPVVTQDTGFGSVLPTGVGLFGYSTTDEAVSAVAIVVSDWNRHSRAASAIAKEFFSHEVVLTPILQSVGIDSIARRRLRSLRSASERDATSSRPCLKADLLIEPVAKNPVTLAETTEEHVLATAAGTKVARPHCDDRDTKPVASIVVVTWNNPVLTRLCLESVLANTEAPSFEVVVVDNASSRATTSYLERLEESRTSVRLLRIGRNIGFPAATNIGLAEARGDVFVLLNNDTIVPPGWLCTLVSHLDDESVGLVGPVTNETDGEARIRTDYRSYGQLLAFAAQRAIDGRARQVEMLTMFCAAMRRDVYERIGPLDVSFGLGLFEDDDYSMRLRRAGYRLICAEDVFVHHFGRGSFGALVPSGSYNAILDRNKLRFESKWGIEWSGRPSRRDLQYEQMAAAVRSEVLRTVPAGARVAIVSRGDETLVALPGRGAVHFPGAPDGSYAGHYPADDQAAVAQLENLRDEGFSYLVFPATSRWWLDRYPGLREWLGRFACEVSNNSGSCSIFEFSPLVVMSPEHDVGVT
jgi:GT2 family glycosyltransferase